ncbi:glycosyltransferase family 2 protein [uncultured Treponema sp.]|uniref:glycosyltransferase family 2 protein n=1 Tax=uncultured Treponema sp. TaxID=162155 RepID=UPI0025E35CCD|nr:glycosyltransferase family 2 protein [uncultured Treponema sp.]
MNVSAVIITFNPNINDLQKLLQSLVPQVEKIIIVDNGSGNIASFSLSKNIELIKLCENKGIALATNVGLKRAIELNADFIIISDQDSVFPCDYVKNFFQIYSKNYDKDIAAYTPVFYEKNSDSIKPVYIKKFGFIVKQQQKNATKFVYQSIASGMIINTAALHFVGFMNENLFIDSVDFEWCWKVQYCGKKILSVKNLKLVHSLGDKNRKILHRNISAHSLQRYFYITRNTAYLSFHCPYIALTVKIQLFFKAVLYVLGYSALSKGHFRTVKTLSKAFIDGIRGNLGKKDI